MKFQFDNIQQFLAMGHHGFYVWLAYGVAVSVLIYLVLSPLLQKRQFIRQQLAAHRREDEAVAANRSI